MLLALCHPVEILLYENGMRSSSEVQETLEVFQVFYNLHFSKVLSDCSIKTSCATSNKYLGSIWVPLSYIKLSSCNLCPIYAVLLTLNPASSGAQVSLNNEQGMLWQIKLA